MVVLTLLGAGTSSGVPVLACRCKVCRSRHPRNKRTRASAWFQVNGKSILIDTSPDLHFQAMREKIERIDAVLFTHPHADHIHGIDELRSYNFAQKAPIPAYCFSDWTYQELQTKFEYIFRPPHKPEGGGIPQINLQKIDRDTQQIDIQGVSVIPIPVEHGSKPNVGFRIDSVAYVTDTSYIPEHSLQRLRGLSALVLDCVQLGPHRTHLNLDRALEVIESVRPKKTYLTHLGHEFDYPAWKKKLPKGVELAYDGLKIKGASS